MRVKKVQKSAREVIIGNDEPVFTTGVVCRLLGIPVWVLKQLDDERIVVPPREVRKARLYSKSQLDKVRHCWHYLKEKRVKVTGLKVILEMEERYGLRGGQKGI